jgi:hypothetical protein
MDKRSMQGFVDPITLGFILSIVGSVTVLSLEPSKSSDQQGQKVAADSVEMGQLTEESKSTIKVPGS